MDEACNYLAAPMKRHKYTVARLIIDGMQALFCAPIVHQDAPQRAALAGLDIVKGIQRYRK